jgi:hypothetical protein
MTPPAAEAVTVQLTPAVAVTVQLKPAEAVTVQLAPVGAAGASDTTLRLPPTPPAVQVRGRKARGRARVYPRLLRRSGTVAGHRRQLRRSAIRVWEAVAWIAAIGVVATLAGFVISAAPKAQPIVAGAQPTVAPQTLGPSADRCAIQGCPRKYPAGPPTRVRIPAIGVDSTLESLALDRQHALVPPTRYDEAGWYAGGVLPGDPGPAVIAGHVDSTQGPGVFFNLHTVMPGAVVSVERGGAWITFRVTAVEEYPKDEFPTDKVYRPTPDPELRVITCGGDFDTVHKRYYDNIVVYAVLS